MDWLESTPGDQGLTRGILTYKLPVPSVIDRIGKEEIYGFERKQNQNPHQ